jgi:hypothetical protein
VTIDGEVDGQVVVIFGELELNGRVNDQVVAIMADQRYRDAEMRELVSILGSINLERTRVDWQFVNILGALDGDGTSSKPSFNFLSGLGFKTLASFLLAFRLVKLFVVFLLVLLVCALAPERVRVIGEEAPQRYVSAFFVGLLAYLALLVVLPLLLATVIGIPVAILGYYALKWLGIAGVFYAVGRRLGRAFGRDMSLLGAVLLTFGLYAALLLAMAPLGLPGLFLGLLVQLVFFLVVVAPALGLLVLTRAGGRRTAIPPPPPAPAVVAPVSPTAG